MENILCEARGKYWQKQKFDGTRQQIQIKMMKKDVESDGEEGDETGDPQRLKCRKLEAKATGKNVNSSNTIPALNLLNEMMKQCKILEIRTAIVSMEWKENGIWKTTRKYNKTGNMDLQIW